MIVISKRILFVEFFSCAYFVFSVIFILYDRIVTNIEFMIKLSTLSNIINLDFNVFKVQRIL